MWRTTTFIFRCVSLCLQTKLHVKRNAEADNADVTILQVNIHICSFIQQRSGLLLYPPHPSQVGPAALQQPIARAHKHRQPIKASAPSLPHKRSIVYCCLASCQPPSIPLNVDAEQGERSLSCHQILEKAVCIVRSVRPDKMSLAARPEPTRARLNRLRLPPAASQSHRKHVKVGGKKNKLTLCPAAHLGKRSVCVVCKSAGGHICTDHSCSD